MPKYRKSYEIYFEKSEKFTLDGLTDGLVTWYLHRYIYGGCQCHFYIVFATGIYRTTPTSNTIIYHTIKAFYQQHKINCTRACSYRLMYVDQKRSTPIDQKQIEIYEDYEGSMPLEDKDKNASPCHIIPDLEHVYASKSRQHMMEDNSTDGGECSRDTKLLGISEIACNQQSACAKTNRKEQLEKQCEPQFKVVSNDGFDDVIDSVMDSEVLTPDNPRYEFNGKLVLYIKTNKELMHDGIQGIEDRDLLTTDGTHTSDAVVQQSTDKPSGSDMTTENNVYPEELNVNQDSISDYSSDMSHDASFESDDFDALQTGSCSDDEFVDNMLHEMHYFGIIDLSALADSQNCSVNILSKIVQTSTVQITFIFIDFRVYPAFRVLNVFYFQTDFNLHFKRKRDDRLTCTRI